MGTDDGFFNHETYEIHESRGDGEEASTVVLRALA